MKRILTTLALMFGAALTAAAGTPTVTVSPDTRFTGRGNSDEVLLTARVASDDVTTLRAVTVALDPATDLTDITKLRLQLRTQNDTEPTVVLGRVKVRHGAQRIDLRKTPLVLEGSEAVLELVADIADRATEGHRVAAALTAIETDGGTVVPEAPVHPGREILLVRKRLYAPGDYGSRNWRIPALRCLPDGSLLAVNDKRKYNETDLPEDIDIVARRSTDGGRTWSEPVDIAVGTGYKKGFGDPALAVTPEGDIVCVFVGGNGLWASTLEDPQRSYVARSSDGGRTWSEPEEITSVIYGPEADNPQCRNYTSSFFGSGNGLTLTRGKYAGRILFVAAMCPARNLNNHAVYSDDGGRTWHVSDLAFEGGDEAKVVELTDGRVLMSVRRSGKRGYNISEDGGATWGEQGLWPEINTNACNGDMIRYSATDEGGAYDLLLHSIPNDRARRNVSIFLSPDEGRTWVMPKTICPYESVYSSLTVLPDGTIGAYIEENPTPAGCELWYMNFSLDWLMNNKK